MLQSLLDSDESKKKIGMNNSIIHVDFMVGGPELSVIGTVIGT